MKLPLKKQGIFYLLPFINNNTSLTFQEYLTCYLTLIQWRLGNSIFIACENKSQAKKIDNILWNFDHNSFLPHNLFEKNKKKAPVIIYWSQCYYDNTLKDILINLMFKNKDFFLKFNKIIDFVPTNNTFKNLARIRYSSYKNIGFQLKVIKIYK